MTENKKHTQEEEVEETQTEAVAESDNTDQHSAEVDSLNKTLAEVEPKTA